MEGNTAVRRSDGVLSGAFAILAALSEHPAGLGLTALAAVTALPKSTVHRICEQLQLQSAVERHEGRYVVGRGLATLGKRWLPDPGLHRAAHRPIRILADVAHAMTSVHTMDDTENATLAAMATPPGRWLLPADIDRTSLGRTALGRVLYATSGNTTALHQHWSAAEVRSLTQRIADPGTVVLDHQEAADGICCAAAPIWTPDGRCAGVVSALLLRPNIPPRLGDQVLSAARAIERRLTPGNGPR